MFARKNGELILSSILKIQALFKLSFCRSKFYTELEFYLGIYDMHSIFLTIN
jgi:hypothetical protein